MAVQSHDSPLSGPLPARVPLRATCSVCDRSIRILKDGTIGPHTTGRREIWNGRSSRCPGWGRKPKGGS